jgi:aspartyl protease family protein
MRGDDVAEMVFVGLALLLPLSALLARRISLGEAAKMALAWIGLFALVLVGVGLVRGRGWAPIARLIGDEDQQVSGGTVRIKASADGHFWADVAINGVHRRMLVDSGATTTALSLGTARAAGLELDAAAYPAVLNTANGRVAARVSKVERLTLGPITARNLEAVVSPAFGDTDVLGMNFLLRLASWRVANGELELNAAHNQ